MTSPPASDARFPRLETERAGGVLTVTAFGAWALGVGQGVAPQKSDEDAVRAVEREAESASALAFRLDPGATWDSSLLAVFVRMGAAAGKRGATVDGSALPERMGRLLALALGEPAQRAQPVSHVPPGLLELVGAKTLAWPGIMSRALAFLGEVTSGFGRLLTGRAAFSRRDMWLALRECGVDALPIVALTSLLLGLILAFVSSIQLKMFGAEVYTAALVGVAMVRVMGPVLTGIVLAGRTGASFAAIIGSMQANEEVDALITFGIEPVDFLVLPRVIALVIMTPLLTIYADIMGILGGFVVGLSMGIAPATYWDNTLTNISLSYVWIGLFHAFVFGFVVSLAGCYQGIRSGRNAEAVGRATTAAVVNSIVGIIVSTSIITIVLTVIDL